jgi:putative hydrolase of the HAD superfamily
VRYLVWDFDNTLAHRPGMWSQCLADLANQAAPGNGFTRELFVPHLASGFPWHTPEISHPELSGSEPWWSNLNRVLAKALAAGAGFEFSVARSLARQVRSRYLQPDAWRVYEDVQPTLAALTAAGWEHIILSNHVPELSSIVAGLGIESHFRSVLSSAVIGYEKPHAMAFAAAVRAAPEGARLVMVGDSFVADYQGALAAGLEAVLVRNSHPDCQHYFSDLRSLVTHLDDA